MSLKSLHSDRLNFTFASNRSVTGKCKQTGTCWILVCGLWFEAGYESSLLGVQTNCHIPWLHLLLVINIMVFGKMCIAWIKCIYTTAFAIHDFDSTASGDIQHKSQSHLLVALIGFQSIFCKIKFQKKKAGGHWRNKLILCEKCAQISLVHWLSSNKAIYIINSGNHLIRKCLVVRKHFISLWRYRGQVPQ